MAWISSRTVSTPTHGFIPSIRRGCSTRLNFTPTYEYERRVLQLLQVRGRPAALAFEGTRTHAGDRSPGHAVPGRQIRDDSPRRDGGTAVGREVYTETTKAFTDDLDLHYLRKPQRRALEHQHSTHDELPRRQRGPLFDIDFRAMQADPIGAVRSLYDWLGHKVSPEFEPRDGGGWWKRSAENREILRRPGPQSVPESTADGATLVRRVLALSPLRYQKP